ncbi:TPA: DUF3991 domain-containing protein [Enterococcus faecalis]|nr:DUF3991 domain-containing protein [Enterococcus faecalis]HBI1783998.1 DUF3991 domain-containing protein [Enterococcus faecalis]HBI1786590.1 DUF3991 domain-containing protein [Enterococcus faecalis]HBI1791976.1 DUF3991 domain-containing protein [Enterococcus faecalis]HBI1887936.1 DUF3991 domain-containing protein [Enterococcus faecalis]
MPEKKGKSNSQSQEKVSEDRSHSNENENRAKLSFNELKAKAKQVSIVDFARAQGLDIIDLGNKWATDAEHDSLRINKFTNRWWQNSVINADGKTSGGDTIAFAQEYLKLGTFKECVAILTNTEFPKAEIKIEKKEPFRYYFKHAASTEKVENYLINKRGLDEEIVKSLIHKGMIQQDVYGQAIFVWNQAGKRVGASVQGIEVDYEKNGPRGIVKKIAKNSQKHFGFNITLGKNPNKIFFFEAPIDALSYWSLNKEKLKDCMLFCLDGTHGMNIETVISAINHLKEIKNSIPKEGLFFGVDNDPTGHQFWDQMNKYEKFHSLIPLDHWVLKDNIRHYQEASAAVNGSVEWELIAGVHKALTDMSNKTTVGNGWNYRGYYSAISPGERNDYVIDVGQVSIQVAKALNESRNANTGYIDVQEFLRKPQPDIGVDVLRSLDYKVKRYYGLYKEERYKPVDVIYKDWNDILKVRTAQGLERKMISEAYERQDGEQLELSVKKREGKKKMIATRKRFDQTVGYYEADSAHEMAFLLKNYGYQAVDREDQKKYAKKDQLARA